MIMSILNIDTTWRIIKSQGRQSCSDRVKHIWISPRYLVSFKRPTTGKAFINGREMVFHLRTYRSLAVGETFSGTGRTITETDLSFSCMLSGDWHPLHADERYAATAGLGKRALHGPFGILVAMGMSVSLPTFADKVIAAAGIRDWAFKRPLFAGDTVHVEVAIESKRLKADGKRAVVERRLQLVDHAGEVIQEGIVATILYIGDNDELGTCDRTQ